MPDLTGTTAEGVKFLDYFKMVFTVVIRADNPSTGETPQYIATDEVTISGQLYEDLLVGLSFADYTELNLKAGVARTGNIQVRIANAGQKAPEWLNTYFLENDVVEVYAVVIDGTETSSDLIPVGRGVITRKPYGISEWTLDVIDASNQEEVPIPTRLIVPAVGNSFEYAPLDQWDLPLPMPFGVMELGPYDGLGKKAFLSPCRSVNAITQKYTAGLYCKAYGQPYQWYSQADRLAEIVSYTQTGGYFTIDSSSRVIYVFPALAEGTNDVADWNNMADGETATGVTIFNGDNLHVRMGGIQKVGSLTQDPTIEVVTTSTWDYDIELAGTSIKTGTISTSPASIALPQTNWDEDWDFESLVLKLSTSSTATFIQVKLKVTFNDQSPLDFQAAAALFQKVQGLDDQTSHYRDGGLITGVAGTLLENPVDIIQAVARHVDLGNRAVVDIDTASFTAARAKRAAWKYAFPIFEPINDVKRWMHDLCEEAGLHLYEDRAGKLRIVARDKTDRPEHTFLTQWNICCIDEEAQEADLEPELDFDDVENRDLLNDFIIHGQFDRTRDRYNVRATASSAYVVEGTGSLDKSTGGFTWTGGRLQTLGVERGWVVYFDSDQAYRLASAPTSETQAVLTPVIGGTLSEHTDITFWLGQNLDPDVLRSRRRHKTLNRLGSRGSLRNLGGYKSPFIADEATCEEKIKFDKDWYTFLPKIINLSVPAGHLDVEEGDTCIFDDPWIEAAKRPQAVTTLDGALNASSLTFKVATGEIGLLQEGDCVLIRDHELEPEVMFIASSGIDVATDIATVEKRSDVGTKAYAHSTGATVERVIYFWEVLAADPPAIDDMRIRLKLLEKPLDYCIALHMAPESLTGTWDTWTLAQRFRYGAMSRESGLVKDRDPTTRICLAQE